MEEIFSGSHEDLEQTAQQLYSSPPQTQHLGLEALSIKTPQQVPPTPDTALLKKIEKSLGSHLHIRLQQQMRVFEAAIMETLNKLTDQH